MPEAFWEEGSGLYSPMGLGLELPKASDVEGLWKNTDVAATLL